MFVAACLGSLLLGCGGPSLPSQERIHTRLTEDGVRGEPEPASLAHRPRAGFPTPAGTAAAVPTADIGDDTRAVLASYERHLLAYQKKFPIGLGGNFSIFLPLGPGFREGQFVLLEGHLKPPRGPWRRWPTVASTVRKGRGEGLLVEFRGKLPVPPGSGTATIHAIRPVQEVRVESALLEIPRDARLAFELGNEGADEDRPPIRYTASVCRGAACTEVFSETLTPGEDGGVIPWTGRSVPLDEFAGQQVTIRFEATSPPPARVLPTIANPRLVGPAGARDRRPNVVILSIDTLRADRLDAYGHPRRTAPFLSEDLAARGVVVERAMAEASTTDASHMTLFTGLPALVHRVHGFQAPIRIPAPTLAGQLRAEGYETAAFTENGPLAHHRGFGIGFDRYVENKSSSLLLPSGQVDKTFAQARDWLSGIGSSRFFLFLHTFQVHHPYSPSVHYAKLFRDDDLAADTIPEANAYDAEIRMVDDELSVLVTFMEANGLLDDTLFIVLSDHGEEFKEHGSRGHATLPYETVLHVPFIVFGPGIAKGLRVDEPAHHIDLLPTVLELTGIAAPPGLPGRSLAGLLRGEGSPTSDRTLFSATWVLPEEIAAPALAVRRGDRKLIRWKQKSGEVKRLLFDLKADPQERSGREPSAEEVSTLDGLLDAYASEAARTHAALSAADPGDEAPVALDPAQEEKLRALGYIE